MATVNTTTTEASNKQTRWLLITLIVLLCILAAGGAGGAWLYMSGRTDATRAHAKTAPPAAPLYVVVEPLTVNLHDKDRRILYIGISLQVADKSTAERLEKRMPQVRNRILMTLTDQKAAALMTAAGKRTLAAAILDAVSRPFKDNAEPLGIDDVLFTNFIVQ